MEYNSLLQNLYINTTKNKQAFQVIYYLFVFDLFIVFS